MKLIEVLQELGVSYKEHGEHHHATPGWVSVDCPYCSPSSQHYRLGINLTWGGCNCWVCGTHPLRESLHLISGRGYGEIKGLTAQIEREGRAERKASGKLILPLGLGPLKPCHKDYLRRRKLDLKVCERLWGLQGIGLASRLAWRLFLPIHWRGEVCSWTTRSISDQGSAAKYLSAGPSEEKYLHKDLLYGADLARHVVIVVEGPLDAIRIGPGAVATMGLNTTPSQIAEIARFPTRYVCMDAEEQAQRLAKKLCNRLSLYPGKTHRIELETGKDPGEASDKEIKQLRRLLV